MTNQDWKEASRKAGGVALTVVGVGAGIWTALILADILTFLYFYISTANVLQDYGWSEYGSKFLGVLFSAVVSYSTHNLLWQMVKRDMKAWVPTLTAVMAFWFLIMYVVSSPYGNSPFNPFDGKPGNYYRDQFGSIVQAPRGMKTGPAGEAIKPFDQGTAQEYERQHKLWSPKKSSWFDSAYEWAFPSEESEIRSEVERIVLDSQRLMIQIAVSRGDNDRVARFYPPQGNDYLVTETGTTYNLAADGATYEDLVNAGDHKPYTGGKFAKTRAIRRDEVYRFYNYYPRPNPLPRHLRMYDSRFGVVDLDHHLRVAKQQLVMEMEQEILRKEAELRARQQQEEQNRARQAEEEAARVAQAQAEAEAQSQENQRNLRRQQEERNTRTGPVQERVTQEARTRKEAEVREMELRAVEQAKIGLLNEISRLLDQGRREDADNKMERFLQLWPDDKDAARFREALRKSREARARERPAPQQAQKPFVGKVVLESLSFRVDTTRSPMFLTRMQLAPPRIVRGDLPHYPESVQNARVQGKVIFDCSVMPSGEVGPITVVKSVAGLDQAADEAVRKWRFSPLPKIGGTPIPTIVRITFAFTLSERQ